MLPYFVALLFITRVTNIAAENHHDDLIIAVGDQLELLKNGTASHQLTLDSHNASKLSSLTYDPISKKLFFADKGHDHGHIFSVNLSNETNRTVQEIVEKSNNETVEGVAYDPVDRVLLWTDGLKRSIRRIRIDHEHTHVKENTTIELVHFLEKDDKPRALVTDPCNRVLYWTNRYMRRPTIERSYLNGTQRRIVIQTNLLMPHALDLDLLNQRIYWADNLRNGYFHIERSFVNGTDRQLIYRGIGQFVVSLTVGRDFVYWSDYDEKKVWCILKDGSSERPDLLRMYSNSIPMGLAVLNRQPINCSRVPAPNFNPDDQQITQPVTYPADNLDEMDLCFGFCYNGGLCTMIDYELECSCQSGFTGDRCQKVIEKESKLCAPVVEEVTRTQILALIGLSLACVILTAFIIILSLRLKNRLKFKRQKRRSLPRPAITNNVPDLENVCNSFTLCERACPQQQPCNTGTSIGTTQENSRWMEDCDNSNLLKNDFLSD